MATVYQVVCSLLIVAATVFFARRNDMAQTGGTKAQMCLALFQVLLFGWFFALCASDILDVRVSFSYVRFILNVFYTLAFASVAVYTFVYKHKDDGRVFRCVVWAYIALIAVQCFVFPYGTEKEILRIIEALEGAVVFALLFTLLFRMENEALSRKILIAAVVLEFLIAAENVILPFASITEDPEAADIPMNYASLFMRPVLFATLALLNQVRLDIKKRN